MTAILGISAFYHDSAAALVIDGKITAAAQEERFTRKKNDRVFPRQSIAYCLTENQIELSQLDYIAYYEKPLVKFDRLLESYLAFAPRGFNSFRKALPEWLGEKLFLKRTLRQELKGADKAKLVFVEHHESHAASAFFPSPYNEAAILTLDGVGEWATGVFGVGSGNQIQLEAQMDFPHSLGLLYSAFTYYCGFTVNSGEYKLMGLAPYGKPVYAEAILDHLIDLKNDGSFWMDQKYFDYGWGLVMTSDRFHRMFGGPPRKPEELLEQRHMNLAASIQVVTEKIILLMAAEMHKRTGLKNLVLAGGVALNCVANGRLSREGLFDNIWIQPAAGDAGAALGAALFVWHQLLDRPRCAIPSDRQQGSLLGPSFSNDTIANFLVDEGVTYRHLENEDELLDEVATLLIDGKIIGWFQGRMEFGPRALGARSILADPRNGTLQARLNLKIKYRESFRPFAPAVLAEKVQNYFEMREGQESPYMLHVSQVCTRMLLPLSEAQRETMVTSADLRQRINIMRSTIPAVTHVDNSARVQTVDEARCGRFYRLIKTFDRRTDCPLLINTSFNIRGEPLVMSPRDAFNCFMATELDALVMGNFIILKSSVDLAKQELLHKKHFAQFGSD